MPGDSPILGEPRLPRQALRHEVVGKGTGELVVGHAGLAAFRQSTARRDRSSFKIRKVIMCIVKEPCYRKKSMYPSFLAAWAFQSEIQVPTSYSLSYIYLDSPSAGSLIRPDTESPSNGSWLIPKPGWLQAEQRAAFQKMPTAHPIMRRGKRERPKRRDGSLVNPKNPQTSPLGVIAVFGWVTVAIAA